MIKYAHMILFLNLRLLQKNYKTDFRFITNRSTYVNLHTKYYTYCHRTNHSISACFKIHRDDKDKREVLARSKYPQKSFVQYFRSPSNVRTNRNDNRYQSRSISRNNYNNNTNSSQNKYCLHLELAIIMTKIRFLHIILVHGMTTLDDSRSYRSLCRRDSLQRYRTRCYSRDNNFSKFNFSFRPPSRQRDSRYSRSLSRSNTRDKMNTIQSQTSNYPINFEIHMYHSAEMSNALTSTSWFYFLYTHTPDNQNKYDCPSRLETAFFLDSGASASVLNFLTYVL